MKVTALDCPVLGRAKTMRKTVTDFAARLGVLAIAVALSQLWFANNAAAQTLRFKASRDVITAPVNYSGSIVVTNLVTVSGIGGNTVSLSVSGLPSGVTASLTDQGGNAEPTTAQSTNLWITLSFSGSVADGIYTFSLNASGLDTNSAPVNNSLPFTLEVGSVWNGPANVAANGQSDWSDATKWLPNTLAPGSGADVVIGDVGCQTNPIINGALTPNIVVSADTTVSSIRFAQTNAVQYQSVLIGGGHTLTVNGAGGFSIQRDYIADSGYGNVTPQINVTFAGTNGATLAVNNESANFSILDDTSGNNQRSTYDFSPLDYLTTDVSRMALGDYTAFPNYMTYSIGNSYNGVPRRFLPNINLAKTNVIKAVFADPYNYTNGINRQYSLSYLNTEQAGTSTQPTLMLGISNMFLVDSVNFVGANQQGNVQFNRSLLIYTNAIVGVSTNYYTNSMVAYFRNPTNGPLSVFSISDAGGTNGANSNVKATIDLSLGTVDILADRFFISRDRPRVNSGQNPNYQGTFIMGAGTVNVNTAILGYQEYSDQTNEVTFNGYCEGTVTIQSNGLFQVNNDLILGYGTQTNALGLGSGGNTTYGKLNILNGGTLAANKIEVGIPAFTSMNNYIIVSNAATLIVSNTIASTNKMLDSLKFDNATLSLNVDGTSTTPLVYATNLVTVGNNTVNIMSIANPGSVAIPLIRYVVPGASFSTLTMPGGYVGALIDDGVGTIYLNVLTNAPKNLVWRGYSSSSWDLTTKNWLDTGTGLQTNFANGDNVAFDDASGIPTSINLAASTIIVGAMTVTNSANAYTFAGSGNVVGSLVKTGTNSLEIDGPTSLNVEIDSGSFTGLSGSSVGQVTILAGAQMNFAGNIKGGVTCAGTGTISGNVVGGLTLQS
ncbi:MAG TPA: hypothetical protein VFV81_02665, partial [Verrucomicrobiae bacterium]|nr:hypothetical protein [Verrucomicrobiae bacterium]